ncbi:unnamed protein product [Rotaria magnacalcarata]|uniref:Uncharacterized protein n=2 Tax=Rotaria magnacalcarata TaxID=392030 RepID=A0A820I1P0_9BILA|nr:unnamed protein product [Rotaria magnacalcarata]
MHTNSNNNVLFYRTTVKSKMSDTMNAQEIQAAIKTTKNRMKRRKQIRARHRMDLNNLRQSIPSCAQDLSNLLSALKVTKQSIDQSADIENVQRIG